MTAKKNYSDEDIKSLPYPENVRQRPQIFIGNLDEKGSLTCFREILNNSVDEFLRGKFCTEIKITQHSKNSFTIEDNGRGIPLNSLHKVFGELYTGRNYTKNVDKSFTTGFNGVGSSVVNALSSSFIAISKRDGFTSGIEFKKGILIETHAPSKAKGKDTSTTVFFELDADIFEEFCSTQDIINLIQEASLINTGLKFIYINEEDPGLNKEYYYSRGIIDVLDFYTKKENRLTTPVTFEDVSDDFKLSVAFAYSNKIEDENILSFCNTIRTSEHGTHVTGFKRVISQYLTQYIKDKKLVKEEIINEDVFSGLEAVISIFSFEPKYSSQTKQRLENKEINGYVFKVAFKYIQAWLNENPKEIQKLANKFALVAKARIAAKKALDTVRKDANALSIPLNLSKFSDCLSNSASDECELWIVEGASAGGSIKDARNKFNQALYELKGKPLNCLNRDVNSVLDNIEMGSLFNNILGIGLKDKADLSKTKFTKIIIASDADSDGLHIQLLMIANLLEFLPTLIEDGRLYIAQPPLYRISSGKNLTFLQTTEELNDFLLQEAVKNVQFVYNGKVVKKNVEGIFKQLLTYQKKCTEIAKKYSINPSILELAFINTFDLDEISFDLPEKLFHESENLTVSGFYKHSSGNEYYITLINADVESFIEDITLLHTDYFDLISNLDFQGIKTNNPSLIGKFTDLIDLVNKKNNIIRLKGLGETESDDLKITTMDPATRKLVQVTYDTIENAIEVCNQYMNPHKKFVGFRKQFIVDMFEEVFDKEKCNE